MNRTVNKILAVVWFFGVWVMSVVDPLPDNWVDKDGAFVVFIYLVTIAWFVPFAIWNSDR